MTKKATMGRLLATTATGALLTFAYAAPAKALDVVTLLCELGATPPGYQVVIDSVDVELDGFAPDTDPGIDETGAVTDTCALAIRKLEEDGFSVSTVQTGGADTGGEPLIFIHAERERD